MKYNPNIHHRHSIRLKGYDYSQNGLYFITLCAYNRDHLFGEIINDEMLLNPFGMIVHDEWIKSAKIRAEIQLDEFVVMPNHFHGIVMIRCRGGRRSLFPVTRLTQKIAPSNIQGDQPVAPTKLTNKSIGSLVAGFKSAVTKKINEHRDMPGISVWQRNYHEHIIRNEESLGKIRDYVIHNPYSWKEDKLFS